MEAAKLVLEFYRKEFLSSTRSSFATSQKRNSKKSKNA
jgi:hypothetical protein